MSERYPSLFLSPHNDDETLFGAYTLLRENPHVIVCLRSQIQEDRYGITAATREAETIAATKILGCTVSQTTILDDAPNWADLEEILRRFAPPDKVYAPAWEEGGHPHHNAVAEIALRVFGAKVKPYLTYTVEGKSEWGEQVPYEPDWPERKRCALACYRSQITNLSTAAHFERPLWEFYA